MLSTNPDPDHVTHAHAGEAPAPAAVSDHSPTPSIDSDKENNIEMVNLLLHPGTSGKLNSPHRLKEEASSSFDDAPDEDSQQEEAHVAKDELKPSTKVCDSLLQGSSMKATCVLRHWLYPVGARLCQRLYH